MNNSKWSRRDVLQTAGLLTMAAPFVRPTLDLLPVSFPQDPRHKKLSRPLTAVVLGAGNRGNTYAEYSEKFPDELKIVGVAEPIEIRRKRFSDRYRIPEQYQWLTWEHSLRMPKFADILIITTPDHLHYGPAMGGLDMGYDLLLEKPIAQRWKECYDIMKLTQRKNRVVAICHVLRYTPYFRKLKEIMESGTLGALVSVQHLEPVEHVHMSHSFVRGNWRNSKESNPMILAKSCHDLDILRWMIGKPCRRVYSAGSLKWFKKENAPAGSTPRCTDGCKVEPECPYSALRIYYRNRTWLHHFDLPAEGDKGPAILQAIKEGPYGRCVYACDNDVVDHQIVSMEFADQITVAFSMEAFTSYGGRRTRVMGSMGDVVGDSDILTVADFRTGKKTSWDAREAEKLESGHGGGDFGLVRDFLQAVSQQNPSLLTSTIEASMESHLMAFQAEESRMSGKAIDVMME